MSRAGRLLIIARGAESYGVATELLGIAAGLRAREWSITLYAIGLGEFAEKLVSNAEAAVVVENAIPQRFIRGRGGVLPAYARFAAGSLGVVSRLRAHLRSQRYDAVVFCEPGFVLPVAAAVLRLSLPVFWLMPNTVNGRYPMDLNRRLYKGAFWLSGMIPVANSRFTQASLGRAGHRSECVELGVDPAPFEGPLERDPLARVVPPDSIRLLVMARLVPMKGQQRLLEAILGDPAFDAIHLVLCGGPENSPYEAELRRIATGCQASHRLHLLGATADPVPFLRAADIVASVRTTPEPFGLSIVEAMLAGRPVLAHAAGGPQDIVQDGVTGWLLPDVTAGSLSAGLSRMLNDRDRWPELGAAGRARALNSYTVDEMTARLVAVFARHGVVEPISAAAGESAPPPPEAA